MKSIMCVLFGLLAIVATTSPSLAYTNASLTGCYSYLEHTTDVPNHFPPPALVGWGAEEVGVVCLNGLGGNGTGGVLSYGDEAVVNGNPSSHFGSTGSYHVAVGGYGWLVFGASKYAVVLNSVPGVAPSFQFMRISPTLPELIVGGAAYYQQPNSGTAYNATVLTGCYSWLEEGIAIAPIPTHNGKDQLSQFCFTPTGTTQSGTVTQKGWTDVNGVVSTSTVAGTYTVVPLLSQPPFWGMGTINFIGGRTYEFAVNNVGVSVAGVASSFQFTQIGVVPPPNKKITGGTAFLQ